MTHKKTATEKYLEKQRIKKQWNSRPHMDRFIPIRDGNQNKQIEIFHMETETSMINHNNKYISGITYNTNGSLYNKYGGTMFHQQTQSNFNENINNNSLISLFEMNNNSETIPTNDENIEPSAEEVSINYEKNRSAFKSEHAKEEYQRRLKNILLTDGHLTMRETYADHGRRKVLRFGQKTPIPTFQYFTDPDPYSIFNHNSAHAKKRNIAECSEKVLDAPQMVNDYYLNLIHWSSDNIIAVGLASTLYLWNESNSSITTLLNTAAENPITSVQWKKDGCLAVGMNDGTIALWDVGEKEKVWEIRAHSLRVGCLSWNNSVLSSGSKDGKIMNHDMRTRTRVSCFKQHTQEICGLTWDKDGKYLCSGGNDARVCVWQLQNGRNRIYGRLKSNLVCVIRNGSAAVKALAWCPWQRGLLATGGGYSDQCIRIYDILDDRRISTQNTHSQVCSLMWNPFGKELLSAHGYGATKNIMCVWSYPTLAKTHELKGHRNRILHTTLSPDGEMVCTVGADENMHFWKVFEKTPVKKSNFNERTFLINNGMGFR